MREAAVACCGLLLILASARADDFKTANGKGYKNATITRVEPDGIVLKFSGGIVKLPFTDLPEEIRNKYAYKPEAVRASAQEQIRNEAEASEKWNADFKRIQEGRERYRNVPRYTLHDIVAVLSHRPNHRRGV